MKETLIKLMKPGDVILINGSARWYKIPTKIVHFMIRLYQRRLFGKRSVYKDTHVMLYLSPARIFSQGYPVAKWETIEDVAKKKFTVYRNRWVHYEKFQHELNEIAGRIIGRSYDMGDNLDFLISGLLGYTNRRRIRIFEFSRRRMVCSVAVRTILERLRQDEKRKGFSAIAKLFPGVDVEMTTPAHFANSILFRWEFKKVASWKELNKKES